MKLTQVTDDTLDTIFKEIIEQGGQEDLADMVTGLLEYEEDAQEILRFLIVNRDNELGDKELMLKTILLTQEHTEQQFV